MVFASFRKFEVPYFQVSSKSISYPKLVMGPSPGQALAPPRPVPFSRDWARNFEKGPSSTQAWDRFFEKGLENWDFYVVKNRGPSRLEIELL